MSTFKCLDQDRTTGKENVRKYFKPIRETSVVPYMLFMAERGKLGVVK